MSAEDQEAASLGCMTIIVGWLLTTFGAFTLGWWLGKGTP